MSLGVNPILVKANNRLNQTSPKKFLGSFVGQASRGSVDSNEVLDKKAKRIANIFVIYGKGAPANCWGHLQELCHQEQHFPPLRVW